MKVLLYDTQSGFLSNLWALGADLTNFEDHQIGASSWDDAFARLKDLPDEPIEELHFWGHGTIAAPLINGRRLPSLDQFADAVPNLVRATGLVWLRGCSIFAGPDGQKFAEDAAQAFNCEVASFIRVISAPWPIFQSGCYSLKIKQKPWWTSEPQIKVKKNGEIKVLGSTPFVKNTVWTTDMTLPEKCRKDY